VAEQKPIPWLRAIIKDGGYMRHAGAPSTPLPSLGALTGQDTRVLEAIAACWQCLAYDDDAEHGALAAVRALLPAVQPGCRPFARELIAYAMDWSHRGKYWPLVQRDGT
jgi:hypothetical protein